MGLRDPDLAARLFATRVTVVADTLFTAPAVVLQPITGAWLIVHAGFVWNDFWLLATYALYLLAGLCWLPVVVIQIRLRDLVRRSEEHTSELQSLMRISYAVFCLKK